MRSVPAFVLGLTSLTAPSPLNLCRATSLGEPEAKAARALPAQASAAGARFESDGRTRAAGALDPTPHAPEWAPRVLTGSERPGDGCR